VYEEAVNPESAKDSERYRTSALIARTVQIRCLDLRRGVSN